MNLRKGLVLLANVTVGYLTGKTNPLWTTKNGLIYYNQTVPYIVRGVNWHGMETNCKVPHGLWLNPISFYLDVLKSNEFNSIRLPISYEVMNDLDQPVIPECLSASPDLGTLTVGEFLDVFVKAVKKRTISLLVDLHTIEGRITEYPWTYSVTANQTISAWVNFLKRYGKDIYAIEMKNEPHNECSLDEFISWCGEAIKRIEKETQYQGLYFIAGVQYSFKDGSFNKTWDGVKGDGQGTHFPGSNYRDLSENCALLENSIPLNRIVFSPHIYAPDVSDYFTIIPGPKEWESHFGFINSKDWIFKDSPLIFTELGGRLEGSDLEFYNNFEIWAKKKNLKSGMYWYTLPPTSTATGGLIVGDKWSDLDSHKLDYIKTFISNPTSIEKIDF